MEGLDEIAIVFEKITGVKHKDLSSFAAITSVRQCAKGDFLLQKNDRARYSYFVLHGAFREYYSDAKGREFNKAFCFKGDFTGSYYDLTKGGPSTVSIQALTQSKVLALQYDKFQELIATDTYWLKVAHAITHDLLIRKFEKEYQLLSLSARERYELLRRQQPLLEQYVQGYQIASYLGITPVSFSRIRAELKG